MHCEAIEADVCTGVYAEQQQKCKLSSSVNCACIITVDGIDPALSYNTNGDFPLARATGVCVSGANGVEVSSYALLRRSNWSQLGRCSQREDLLQCSNPPMLTPEFSIRRLIVLWQ